MLNNAITEHYTTVIYFLSRNYVTNMLLLHDVQSHEKSDSQIKK